MEPHATGCEVLPRAGEHEVDEQDQGEHQNISEIKPALEQIYRDPQSELEDPRMAYVFHHAGKTARAV